MARLMNPFVILAALVMGFLAAALGGWNTYSVRTSVADALATKADAETTIDGLRGKASSDLVKTLYERVDALDNEKNGHIPRLIDLINNLSTKMDGKADTQVMNEALATKADNEEMVHALAAKASKRSVRELRGEVTDTAARQNHRLDKHLRRLNKHRTDLDAILAKLDGSTAPAADAQQPTINMEVLPAPAADAQ